MHECFWTRVLLNCLVLPLCAKYVGKYFTTFQACNVWIAGVCNYLMSLLASLEVTATVVCFAGLAGVISLILFSFAIFCGRIYPKPLTFTTEHRFEQLKITNLAQGTKVELSLLFNIVAQCVAQSRHS